jgi:hypothetical protein
MTQSNVFDDVADIMRGFAGDSRSQAALKKYNFQLGAACQLIKHTHSIVVGQLEEIEEASSLAEARALVRRLEDSPLTQSFRANHLCDIFEGFGKSLRSIVEPRHGEEMPALSPAERKLWFEFCLTLEDREQNVAKLYGREIQGIGDLVHAAKSEQDLNNIKTEAKNIRRVLTTQMSNLDSLADEFQVLLKGRTDRG